MGEILKYDVVGDNVVIYGLDVESGEHKIRIAFDIDLMFQEAPLDYAALEAKMQLHCAPSDMKANKKELMVHFGESIIKVVATDIVMDESGPIAPADVRAWVDGVEMRRSVFAGTNYLTSYVLGRLKDMAKDIDDLTEIIDDMMGEDDE